MSRKSSLSILFSLIVPTIILHAEPPAETDPAARAVVERFLKAFSDRHLDDLMTTVAVPWFQDGKTVITEVKELKDELNLLLERRRGLPPLQYAIKQVVAYSVLRDSLDDVERRMIDRVMQPEDRVALIQITKDKSDKKETAVIFVRHRDGQAKVVGVKN